MLRTLFQTSFISTIGIDFKIKTIELEGKKIKLQIWDTAGQERFHTIVSAYYRGAMGIMLVYDVTSRASFDNVGRWLENIENYASESVERVLVGNKCDLNEKRQVSAQEAERLAKSRDIPFFETSARTGDGVESAFLALTEMVLHKTPVGQLNSPQHNSPLSLKDRDGSSRQGGLLKGKCC
ncbi:hypothetical protein BOX15_Mlig003620g1 [Macrostomum lignano]|uniref:Uncharacterized protein n=1 Tax=Macrostomum lignano TaxID=282301 RepID=A0A267EZT3_9PLAT|nr:hypothetical protein BOX15_Mlig003620g1 [Macrostomum lignano]